jgi:hypothetical protein
LDSIQRTSGDYEDVIPMKTCRTLGVASCRTKTWENEPMLATAIVQHAHHLGALLPAALYIGPDVFLPITSALAAIAGVLLMFWQRVVGIVGRLFGRTSKPASSETPQTRSED